MLSYPIGTPSLESEQQFRTLADAIPQLAWMARADGWGYWHNRRWYEYTGTTPEQMEGWGWESVHDPETLAAVLKRWKKCIATGEPFDMVFPLRGADGVFRQFLTRVQPLKNSEGRVVRWFGTSTDVDELKRAEEKLRESEERYRGIFQHAGTGIAITDLEGRFQSCNPAYTAMLGYTEEELRALVFADLVHPHDREANVVVNRRLLAEDIPSFEIVNRYIRKDGAPLWVRKYISLLRDAVGRPFQIIALVTDITARKLAEDTLRRQADLLDQSHDAIFTWKIGGGITYWNKGAEHLYGYTAEEAIGQNSHELLHTRSPVPIQEIESQIVREGSWYGELTQTTRDGCTITVESRHVRVRYDDETYALESNRDITERKAHEEHVRLLMRELNHRAKNMLSVIDAIAHQTAAKNPEDFVERFSERIRSLSANQDLLARNEWKGVGIEDMVRAQLAHFSDLIGSRIFMRGPSLRMNASSAQAIGLALHELATNAGKYGALSTNNGRVSICWGTRRDAFHMSWTECDGPPVSAPNRRGFGTIVMDAMAKRSVGGEVELEYAPSGLSWRLTCPAVNVLDRSKRDGQNSTGGKSQLNAAAE